MVPYTKNTYRHTLRNFKLDSLWAEQHTKAFLDLNAAHVSKPILQAPRYDSSNFVVTSDGCAKGFAAVLSQRTRMQNPTGK
ncbi:hypothetical protein BDR07DRAFT_1312509 [Suillus spraguei]|nr:hypothetical protein BDR07DRAFT_1312509 [Suillus spraguei]